MLPSFLVLPDSWWTLQVSFSSEKLRITSIPFVLISDLVHHHVPVAFLTLLRGQWILLFTPLLSAVPANFRCWHCVIYFLMFFKSLAPFSSVCWLIISSFRESITSPREQTWWCLKCISVSWVKAWKLFPKPALPLVLAWLVYFPSCCWSPRLVLVNVSVSICSFLSEHRYLPKNSVDRFPSVSSICPDGFKVSWTVQELRSRTTSVTHQLWPFFSQHLHFSCLSFLVYKTEKLS